MPSRRRPSTAMRADINQYAITWGAQPASRGALGALSQAYGLEIDPERDLTVTCGSTEAMIATMLALVDPGDEVVVFEPFYENYGPDAILSGAVPRYVRLHEPDWSLDPSELASGVQRRRRAPSSSTRRTTPPARSSPATSWSRGRRLCREVGRDRGHGRDLRVHRLRRRRARPARDAPAAWSSAPSRSTACRRPTP